MAFKRSFTDEIPSRTAEDFKKAGIELIVGRPRFVDPRTIAVDGRRFSAQQIAITTGQHPRTLDIPGGEAAITSDDFLELDELPARVGFVGGGYIAMEFAGVTAALGRETTVLEQATYPLHGFDPDAVRHVMGAYADLGVHVLTHRSVERIEKTAGGYHIVTHEHEPHVEVDLVVNATGRVPSIQGLDLEAGQVTFDQRGIAVDEYLRSVSNPAVWAGGDVAASGHPPLTPVSAEDGRTLAHNLLHGDDLKRFGPGGPGGPGCPGGAAVPSVAFTTPPVAAVGLGERAAREAGHEVEVVSGETRGWKFYRQLGLEHGYYKFIFERDGRALLGAHLSGVGVEEAINLFALAVTQQCSRRTLEHSLMAYPTLSFSLRSSFSR